MHPRWWSCVVASARLASYAMPRPDEPRIDPVGHVGELRRAVRHIGRHLMGDREAPHRIGRLPSQPLVNS